MRATLARFAVVGTLVTLVDVGLFLSVWAGGRRSALVADVVALVVAAVVSYALHRAVTFRGDPYRRGLEQWPTFARAVVVGGVVDLGVVVALTARLELASTVGGLAAKLPAVAIAGVARWALHRWELFHIVRAEQVARPERQSAPGALRFSVVFPAFRERDRIAAAIAEVRHALAGVEGGSEIVVVDDGSGDDTAARAEAAGADQVVVLAGNHGKGAAVRAGVAAARGRTVAFTDADLAYPADQLVWVLEAVEDGWDVVVGSRRHDATTTLVRAGRLRELGGRVINWLTYFVLLGAYRDTQCGLKGFRSDAARLLFDRARVDGFAFDIELFVIAERNRLALTEIPVRVANDVRSTVRVVRDGVRLVRDLFRIRRWARQGAYQAAADPPPIARESPPSGLTAPH